MKLRKGKAYWWWHTPPGFSKNYKPTLVIGLSSYEFITKPNRFEFRVNEEFDHFVSITKLHTIFYQIEGI
jgi:hypothetical protein